MLVIGYSTFVTFFDKTNFFVFVAVVVFVVIQSSLIFYSNRGKVRVTIECLRSCDQKPYLQNETKGGICIKIEFNPQKNISLLQDGRRFFVYSSNMAAVTSCVHSIECFHMTSRRPCWCP